MTTPRPHAWRIVRDGGLHATCVHCGRLEMLGYSPARAARLTAKGAVPMAMADQILVSRWVDVLCDDGDPCTKEVNTP